MLHSNASQYRKILRRRQRAFLRMVCECGSRSVPCGVHGREAEGRPHNHKDPNSIPGSGCQLWDIYWSTHLGLVLMSSQVAESKEISISCKNLFLNRCKINMFKLKQICSRYFFFYFPQCFERPISVNVLNFANSIFVGR